MIVVDTSALMAIVLAEPGFEALTAVLDTDEALAISAGTLAEALIVADRRGVGGEMAALIEGLGLEVAPLSATDARLVALAYARFGRGLHPAGLNLGDCFAYALAADRASPLLFVGDDFARTDIKSARS